MKALDFKHIFHKELDAIYGKYEVESFFFLCTNNYLNLPRFQLTLEPEFTLTKCETNTFFKVLESLKKQIPIQYILGKTVFYNLKFKVNNNVLIPRPETEELVDWIVSEFKTQRSKFRVLDIGTGSGCIAISLAKNLPNVEVYALDISKEALEVARKNAELNKVNVTFLKADILSQTTWDLNFKKLKFDVIISNPPYVRELEKKNMKPNVLNNEPDIALFVDDEDPLQFYKAITEFAVNNIKQNGQLYFEINQYLSNEMKNLLKQHKFNTIELRKDLNGNYRMLKGIKK